MIKPNNIENQKEMLKQITDMEELSGVLGGEMYEKYIEIAKFHIACFQIEDLIKKEYPDLIPLFGDSILDFTSNIDYDLDDTIESTQELINYIRNNEYMHSFWML